MTPRVLAPVSVGLALLAVFVVIQRGSRERHSTAKDAARGEKKARQQKSVNTANLNTTVVPLPKPSFSFGDGPWKEADEDPIQPDYFKAILTAGSRLLSPARVRDRWPSENRVGESLIRIRDAVVESVDNATGETRWRTESKEGRRLRWLGEHRGILFFADQDPDDVDSDDKPAPSKALNVHRLKLSDGSWQKPFAVPLNAVERAGINRVSALLADGDGVVVLNNTEKSDFPENQEVGYRLTRFAADSTEVVWSNAYPSAGTLPSPGAFLLGSFGPARDSAAIRRLSRLGTRILVCGGSLEDLLAISPNDGEAAWRVRRLWEFRRGFIGPSVWQYFLGRFGIQEHDLNLAELTLDELREKNKKRDGFHANEEYFQKLKQRVLDVQNQVGQRPGSIVGGPVVIPTPGGPDDFHIFVATARSERDEWPGYLSDCIVFELNGDGKVIGTLALPRFVHGADHSAIDHSVVWRCRARGTARLFPSLDRGNGDLIIDVDWHVDRTNTKHQAWFQNGGWTDGVVFTGKSMIRVENGGFVPTQASRQYRFILAVSDVISGATAELPFHVPFEGRIAPPRMNYSHRRNEDGTEMWVSYSSAPLSLATLEIRGRTLVIVIKDRDAEHSLEFDLASVLAGLFE
jgi:hypothetical protein